MANEGTEYLDTGGIDLLAMMTPEYLGLIGAPKGLHDKAVKMNIQYISSTGQDSMPLTANAKLVMTVRLQFPSSYFVVERGILMTVSRPL